MAILYRAIWTDADANLVVRVRRTFSDWIGYKSGGVLTGVESDEATPDDALRMRLRYESSDQPAAPVRSALRAVLVENRLDGARLTTTVRSWQGPAATEDPGSLGGWIWVDIDVVAHDSLDNFVVAAPRFVRDLLAEGNSPSRAGIKLASEPQWFRGDDDAESLAAMITDIDRDVPVVAFAPLPQTFYFDDLPKGTTIADRFTEAVESAARRTAGMALVAQLDEEAATSFKGIVGESYEVRDGAFRIYLPGLDPALDEAWKHRYTVPARFMRYRDLAGSTINRTVSPRAGARRAPDSYEAADRFLRSAREQDVGELNELVGLAEEELADARSQFADLYQSYVDSVDEQQQLENDNNRLRMELGRAHRKLELAGPALWHDNADEVQRIDSEFLPTIADSPSDAFLLAQEFLLDHLGFPYDACHELEIIDRSVEARAWGATAWRAFLALHAYGAALSGTDDPGSFWTWCENSGSPYVWPATAKKLAMKESATVNKNAKLKAARTFPVDKSVEPSGRLYMQAHLKIAEGGGLLAPRVYFHVSRNTKMVHIGYFGPHKNVPNTLK